MKTIGLLSILSLMIVVQGCYTQLALNDDQTDEILAPETTVVQAPPPVAYIPEPVFVPVIEPVYLPQAGSAPVTVSQPHTPQQVREIGNQRSGGGESQTPRSTGSHRGGR